jgi:hypothetical protein
LGPDQPLLCADLRALPLRGEFSLALLPYSLVTYLLTDGEWQALAHGLRGALRPGGQVVLDAFVPRAALPGSGWTKDYARPLDGAWLVRHKRVYALGGGRNRIERCYRRRGSFGGRTLRTVETIQTYTPDALVAKAEQHIGRVVALDYDYGRTTSPEQARFCTVRVLIPA